MNSFKFSIPTEVLFGVGQLNSLAKIGRKLGTKALLVTGRNSMRKTGILDRVINLLEKSNVEIIVNEGVEPNPKTTYINEMAQVVKKNNCDFVIGLGGGSSMDAAKAIALLSNNEGQIEDFLPGGTKANMKGINNALPIMAISTTAGTGSEVTMFSVVTNPITKEKPGIGHKSLYPRYAIVDPELMVSVPYNITQSTGIDVLFHGVEAYISKGATPFTDMYSKEAIDIVLKYLPQVLKDKQNLEARSKMAWANTLAGIAITHAGTVGIHGMAHPISGHTNCAHGAALAAVGVAFLEETYDGDIARYANLSQLLGLDISNMTKEKAASMASFMLKNFLDEIKCDYKLRDFNIDNHIIKDLVKDTFNTMAGCIKLTLKKLSSEDVERIFRKSL